MKCELFLFLLHSLIAPFNVSTKVDIMQEFDSDTVHFQYRYPGNAIVTNPLWLDTSTCRHFRLLNVIQDPRKGHTYKHTSADLLQTNGLPKTTNRQKTTIRSQQVSRVIMA